MIDTSWSKLLHTPMGDYVRECMSDPDMKYHNIGHVMRLYAKAAEWHLPYDANLDAAILWHDAVYDFRPEKERRSAEAMRIHAQAFPEDFQGIDVDEVYRLIMSTETHEIVPGINPIMIKLDLAELGDPGQATINFWNIIEESQALYGIGLRQAAEGSERFMTNFLKTVQKNHVLALQADPYDPTHRQFHYDGDAYWSKIVRGVNYVLTMSITVQETIERL